MRQSSIVMLDISLLSPSRQEEIVLSLTQSSNNVAIEYANVGTEFDLGRHPTERRSEEAKQRVLQRLEQLPIDTDEAKAVAEVLVETLIDSADAHSGVEANPHPQDNVEAESGGFASPTPTQIDFYILVLQGILVLIEGIRFAQENRNFFTTIRGQIPDFSFTREDWPDVGESYQLSTEDKEMIFATVESDSEDQDLDQ